MSTPAASPSMARGNTAGKRVFSSIADYVEQFGGNKVIEKILIANNGISAVKAIRSIRRWAYEWFGETSVIKLVVMATPEDIHANAEYVRRADAYVEVPGGGNHNNYANVELIVELAERIGADGMRALAITHHLLPFQHPSHTTLNLSPHVHTYTVYTLYLCIHTIIPPCIMSSYSRLCRMGPCF
eukprot:TRINITY_DN1881_c0_g2_i1.p1 TRINITY_DN1881_c0_g2~~TRINITY_DN1881_c0_g2_i1.p1  ORF type:complete len:185 (+),score=13.23 TRINITY_DN1881_c0_g2_i1:183-737(+)